MLSGFVFLRCEYDPGFYRGKQLEETLNFSAVLLENENKEAGRNKENTEVFLGHCGIRAEVLLNLSGCEQGCLNLCVTLISAKRPKSYDI